MSSLIKTQYQTLHPHLTKLSFWSQNQTKVSIVGEIGFHVVCWTTSHVSLICVLDLSLTCWDNLVQGWGSHYSQHHHCKSLKCSSFPHLCVRPLIDILT
jgi:hypothetical protein